MVRVLSSHGRSHWFESSAAHWPTVRLVAHGPTPLQSRGFFHARFDCLTVVVYSMHAGGIEGGADLSPLGSLGFGNKFVQVDVTVVLEFFVFMQHLKRILFVGQ